MKKRKRILLGIVISIVLTVTAIVLSISSTQALFTQSTTSSRKNNYSTGILSITAISKTDTISLDGAFPMTDELGAAQDPYTFTIRNNGNVDYEFDVQLLATGANTFDPQYIKLKIDNDAVTTLSALTNSKIKTGLTLGAQQSMDISLRVWLASNTPNTQIGKTFTSQLVINGIAVSPTTNYGVSAAAYITNLYNNAAKTVVTNNNIDYNYATSVSLMNDRLGGTTKDLNAGNIRYYGANPNNYIDIGHRTQTATEVGNWEVIPGAPFNTSEGCLEFTSNNNLDDAWASENSPYSTVAELCSSTTVPAGQPILYRIIGVFDNMLKIISEDIGGYSWDTSASSVNNGYGINEWTQADLMKLLNPGYDGNSINNSLYWNAQSGTCYYRENNGTISCDFTSIGLTNTVKNKIATATWYLGGFDNNNIYPNIAYANERGTTHVENPIDGVTRQNTWTGKVGLIYPSDYGYAANFNNCSTSINNYSSSDCTTNNWLYINVDYWTLSPRSDSQDFVWFVRSGGNVSDDSADRGSAVRPVFYLNSEVSIASGTGTSAAPYILR